MKILFIIPGACSFGSMVALEWLKEPYQIGITDAEIRASKEFRAINPLGKVGALKDGDTLVHENLAILLYLVDKNPNSSIGMALNTPKRLEAYKWLSYLSSTLHTGFSPLIYPERFVAKEHVEQFKLKVIENLKNILTYINSFLANREYFIDNKPTIIDAQAYGLLRWSIKVGLLKEYPALSSFIERMNGLNEVKNALSIEQEQSSHLVNSSFSGYYKFSKG